MLERLASRSCGRVYQSRNDLGRRRRRLEESQGVAARQLDDGIGVLVEPDVGLISGDVGVHDLEELREVDDPLRRRRRPRGGAPKVDTR
jgi:hypothetical protein